MNNDDEWLMANDFEKAFACRFGYPRQLSENTQDPGYEAAKWAWDRQQVIIAQLRGQTNAIRKALADIGVG